MRIWLVSFRELDNKRLVAQHHEWHVIEGKIRRDGHRWKGWEDHLAEFYKLHMDLVDEMLLRGYNRHSTEPQFFTGDLPKGKWSTYPRFREEIQEERYTLLTRWGDGEFHGRVNTDPGAWEEVIGRWRRNGNQCVHENGLIVLGNNRAMCPICKKAFIHQER